MVGIAALVVLRIVALVTVGRFVATAGCFSIAVAQVKRIAFGIPFSVSV